MKTFLFFIPLLFLLACNKQQSDEASQYSQKIDNIINPLSEKSKTTQAEFLELAFKASNTTISLQEINKFNETIMKIQELTDSTISELDNLQEFDTTLNTKSIVLENIQAYKYSIIYDYLNYLTILINSNRDQSYKVLLRILENKIALNENIYFAQQKLAYKYAFGLPSQNREQEFQQYKDQLNKLKKTYQKSLTQ